MRRTQCNLEFGCKTSICFELRKTTEQLEPDGRSQDLSDAGLLLANSSTFKYAKSNGSP